MNQEDPIVVTGLGAVSPLGVGVAVNWRRLIAGQSGIVANTRFDVSDYGCKVAGLVPAKSDDPEGFDPLDFLDLKDSRKTSLFIQFALAAAAEGLHQADWHPDDSYRRSRTAVIMATLGGFPAITDAVTILSRRGPRGLSPHVIPSFLPNLAAGHVSIRHGFTGPIGCPATACAASVQAIGDGLRLIATGEADVAVCGGTEACVDPVSIGGFCAARALSTRFNDQPEKASRPFDKRRDGFVLSEGAAVIIIERLSHARARGAAALGILAGYGTCADAYHITAGRPDGAGGAVAMRAALAMAEMGPEDIDYLNAHSTSTSVGDLAEIAAIGTVFAGRGKNLAVTSTKSATGHLQGAAGALAAIYSLLALRHGVVPPSLNIEEPEEGVAQFDLVANAAKEKHLDAVLLNGFGFGGVNASLILKRLA